MSRRLRCVATLSLFLGIGLLAGCNRKPAQPGDPLLEAIRAEERGSGDLNHAESQGKRLFEHYCATCHGDEGRGDGQNASNLTPAPPDMTASSGGDPALVRKVIAEGSASVGRSPLSPPWGRNLNSQEIEYLVSYRRALGRKKP